MKLFFWLINIPLSDLFQYIKESLMIRYNRYNGDDWAGIYITVDEERKQIIKKANSITLTVRSINYNK